eukprot:6285171-Amphidinium_carterae.2
MLVTPTNLEILDVYFDDGIKQWVCLDCTMRVFQHHFLSWHACGCALIIQDLNSDQLLKFAYQRARHQACHHRLPSAWHWRK